MAIAATVSAGDKNLAVLAQQINAAELECRANHGAFIRSVIRIGELLNEARRHLKRGDWGAWLQKNCEQTAQNARRYMAVAGNKAVRAMIERGEITTLNGAIEAIQFDAQGGQVGQRAGRKSGTPASNGEPIALLAEELPRIRTELAGLRRKDGYRKKVQPQVERFVKRQVNHMRTKLDKFARGTAGQHESLGLTPACVLFDMLDAASKRIHDEIAGESTESSCDRQ